VARTHQLDVLSYERRAAARVRDDVVEVQVNGAPAHYTFADPPGRRPRRLCRELADQISGALGHLHRLARVLDDNELDELASGG